MTILCFHNSDEENGYLSNCYISPFSINGISFSSMEQYMMYRKAIIFTDNATAAEILACEDVSRIKELGRLVSGYDESYWNGQNLLGYTLMAVRNKL